MRLVATLLALGVVLAITRPASAEPGELAWSATLIAPVATTIRDGFRVPREARIDQALRASVPVQTTEEPGEALTAAVERMWSQVRAYHRKGGGELVLRGRF